MSRLSNTYTTYDIDREREIEASRSLPIEREDYLTPSQQFALLLIRKSELSKLVVEKLYASTVRPGAADFDELVRLNLAKRKPPGIPGHDILPHGLWKANEVARKLARDLGVHVPTFDLLARQKSRFGTRWNGMAHGENG